MTIAVQIILLIVIILSFIGVMGERQNKKFRDNLTAICLAAIISTLGIVLL